MLSTCGVIFMGTLHQGGHIKRDPEWLQQQLAQYNLISEGFESIAADHINLVNFESELDPGYKTVSGHLRVMAANANTTTKGRLGHWYVENDIASR
jgi:hypothetical protein